MNFSYQLRHLRTTDLTKSTQQCQCQMLNANCLFILSLRSFLFIFIIVLNVLHEKLGINLAEKFTSNIQFIITTDFFFEPATILCSRDSFNHINLNVQLKTVSKRISSFRFFLLSHYSLMYADVCIIFTLTK